MKPITSIILCCMLFCIHSCTGDKTVDKQDSAKNEVDQKEEMDEQVVLNNGQPWKVNPETKEGIINMARYVESFKQQEDKADFVKLSDTLNSEFKLIFKNCTMEGEAHNQLHNYLFPMIAMFKGLKSDNIEDRSTTFKEFEEYLGSFDTYFH